MLTTRVLIRVWVEERGVLMYNVVDSSPQGGRDYELMVRHLTQVAALARLRYFIQVLGSRWFCIVAVSIGDVFQVAMSMVARIVIRPVEISK